MNFEQTKQFIITILIVLWGVTTEAQKLKYPEAAKETIKDIFFDKYEVEDPYRWMENIYSARVQQWVKEETKISKHLLQSYERKNGVFQKIDRYSFAKRKTAYKKGKYFFTYGSLSNIEQSSLFYRENFYNEWELLVNPKDISAKEEVRLQGFSLSSDSKCLAYLFNRDGSDWREIKVLNLKNGTHTDDHLKNVIYSGLEWRKEGFFYSSYNQNGKFKEITNHQIYYHKLGDTQDNDKLVFKRLGSHYKITYTVSYDERFFILKEFNVKTNLTNVFYIDYSSANKKLKPLIINLRASVSIIDNYNDSFIAVINDKSQNEKVVAINIHSPRKWVEIIGGFSNAVLLKVVCFDNQIFTLHQSNQKPMISFYDYTGKQKYFMEFPVGTSVSQYSNRTENKMYIELRGYTLPSVFYEYNTKTYQRKLLEKSGVTFDYRNIEYTSIECEAEDGKKIPVLLVHKKGIKLNGKNPLVLSAYGGFGIVNQPSYDAGIVYFVKQGGIYAFAGIRGSGDLGREWSLAGRGMNKQQSFDDFASVAKQLIKKKYTSSKYLFATGASNGGLVVADVAIQNPTLFRAVIPEVSPFDMIRFEKYTVGHFHKNEYGTIDNKVGFESLYSYSPYHNIKRDVNYPAMLIMTSDNDERVPPLHSYKFVASMQNRKAQKNPILLRVNKNAGHYGSSNIRKSIREMCDKYGFIMEMLKQK